MEQAIQSPFLHALGYAIINSLWQFALLWLVYVSINTLFKLSSHYKYLAGLVLQITGFVWFVVTLAFYFIQCKEIAGNLTNSYGNTNIDLFLIGNTTAKEKFFRYILQTEKVLPYLSVAYLALLTFLSLRWLKAYQYTQSVRATGTAKIDVEWRLFVQQLSYQLGIKKTVEIFISELVKTPLTIGYLKPVILIPLASLNHLDTQQMEAVILHELAHIKRLDYIFNLFLALTEAALFFNPFMQLISRHIKRERENCCDDLVLQYEYNAANYARALLQIASYQNQPAMALKAADDKQVLLGRIKRMIEKKEKNFFNYRHQLLALFVMTIVFSSLAFLTPAKTKSSQSAKVAETPVEVQPLAASVENPFFNPIFFLAKEEKEELINQQKKNEPLVKNIISISSLPINTTLEKIEVVKGKLKTVESERKLRLQSVNIEEIKIPLLDNYSTNVAQLSSSNFIKIESEISKPHFDNYKTFEGASVREVKRDFVNQKNVKEIQVALDKIRTAKRLLEKPGIKAAVKQNDVAETQIIIDFTGENILKMQELNLAEQKLLQQLHKQVASLENNNVLSAVNFTTEIPKMLYTYTPMVSSIEKTSTDASSDLDSAAAVLVDIYRQKLEVASEIEREYSSLLQVTIPAKDKSTKKENTKPKKRIYITRI